MEFKITVEQGTSYEKVYDMLGMDPEHPNYFQDVINNSDGIVLAKPINNTTSPPNNRPANLTKTTLAGGNDDAPQNLSANDYTDALKKLETIDDVNLICIPDNQSATVQQAMIGHCERMKDRFAILDSRKGNTLFSPDSNSVEEHLNQVTSDKGYAALYYPWLSVAQASGNRMLFVPPSGHVAGIYARTDSDRGVHKAPAGNEAAINGAVDIERRLSNTDQGQLNMKGINIIRTFKSGGRPVVWGGRTTATDRNWQYVNTRRLFLFS